MTTDHFVIEKELSYSPPRADVVEMRELQRKYLQEHDKGARYGWQEIADRLVQGARSELERLLETHPEVNHVGVRFLEQTAYLAKTEQDLYAVVEAIYPSTDYAPLDYILDRKTRVMHFIL
ncbi:hypothetical protein HY495_00845 [Candidatus Woesearchaeota archaeon]|nr:hypothetical protein [Candidatus Woesearchaeota archaeon]